jgi:hypothetical protein
MISANVLRGGATQFFTIVAQNYLAYAFVLGDSVLQHHPDATFSIFVVDDHDHHWKPAIEARGFLAIYPETLLLRDFRKFVFQYNVTETSTGVKPFVFQALFGRGARKVIYLDPDMLCLRRFDEVLSALDDFNIVLTPHICSPVPDDQFPGEKALMSSGVYNLGFIALRRSETSKQFLHWWCHHLERECVAESDAGLFVDQKWVDLVPGAFDGVFVLRSLAYNIAYWNLHERALTERNGLFLEQHSGEHVALIHFSGIQLHDLHSICRYVARNPLSDGLQKKRHTLSSRPDLARPFHLYKELLLAAGAERFSKIPYAFATYDNGEPISDLERALFRTSVEWRDAAVNPFQTGNGTFHDACRSAGIRKAAGCKVEYSPQRPAQYATHMHVIQLFLKCCLLILGPQRYLQFAKFMRHQLLPSNHAFLIEGQTPEPDSSELPRRPQRRAPVSGKAQQIQGSSAR